MKRSTLGWIGAAVIATGIGVAVLTNRATTGDSFDTGCVQTVAGLGPAGLPSKSYTGTIALFPFQWGFIAFDINTHVAIWRNGIGKNQTPFCPPAVNVVGDCWQSVGSLTATPGSPKWIIAENYAHMCGGRGLQVWGLVGGNWRFHFIPANIKTPGGQLTLDGDVAYALQNVGGTIPKYIKFDLNALTATEGFASRPTFTPQLAFGDGSTLRLFADHPTPIPQPYPGPHKYHVVHEGQVAGTPSPGPTMQPTGATTPCWGTQNGCVTPNTTPVVTPTCSCPTVKPPTPGRTVTIGHQFTPTPGLPPCTPGGPVPCI